MTEYTLSQLAQEVADLIGDLDIVMDMLYKKWPEDMDNYWLHSTLSSVTSLRVDVEGLLKEALRD